MAVGVERGIRGRDPEGLQESGAVVQPSRAHHQPALAPDRLALLGVFRVDLQQQMAQPHGAFHPALSAVGAVEGHRRPHPLQPIGVRRRAVIAVDAVDSAHVRLRAKVVKTWKVWWPAPPVTTEEPTRSQAWASKADS